MSSPKDSNDSYVKRNAMSIVSADGKKVFRTAFLGYNKSAVNDYIDRLYSEYSDGTWRCDSCGRRFGVTDVE